jgi:hypothetical protein
MHRGDPILTGMWSRRWIAAGAGVVVATGALALAGGFADASDSLTSIGVGETYRTDRADVTVHRAWVSDFRPDENRKYTKRERRLFAEVEIVNRGYRSESPTGGDGFGAGPAPLAVLGSGEPAVFKASYDAGSWEFRGMVHPDVPERLVLQLPLPAGVTLRDRVRLQLDDFTLDESNLLVDRVWVHDPARYVDVPLGPEPPPVQR